MAITHLRIVHPSTLLDLDRRLQLSTENTVPELASDSKSKLIIQEVVLKMVLLELLVPERQVLVMKEVMRQVVANVSENATAVDSSCDIPVVGEDGVCKLPERCSQGYKQGWGHDQTVLVHGQVVMNTVQQKVSGDADSVVRKVAVGATLALVLK